MLFYRPYLNWYLRLSRLFCAITQSARRAHAPLTLHNSYFELILRLDMHDKLTCSKAFHCGKNITLTVKKAGKRPFGDVDSACVCLSVCIYICMCMYMCLCVYIYIYTHIHTHTLIYVVSWLGIEKRNQTNSWHTGFFFFFFNQGVTWKGYILMGIINSKIAVFPSV